jgi:hypothetical protein
MGKMFNTLVMSGLISITLLLLDGSGYLGVIAKLFLSPPTGWGDFIMNALSSGLGIATLGAGIVIGIGAVIKQDWLLRLGFFAVLVSWVEAPFISLWQFLAGKILPLNSCTNAYTCNVLIDGASQTTLGMIIAALIVGPMVLYGLWACFSWIWSPESSG